ncbi:hypothetical protein DA2_1108 [Desulfovibrio sp. A2]|nr:hypothetical protein DA2_1108 [Desulfovibrio sp. A2]
MTGNRRGPVGRHGRCAPGGGGLLGGLPCDDGSGGRGRNGIGARRGARGAVRHAAGRGFAQRIGTGGHEASEKGGESFPHPEACPSGGGRPLHGNGRMHGRCSEGCSPFDACEVS